MRTSSRKRLIATLLAGAVVLWPAVLWAHARLTRSEPGAKTELAVVPTVIRLWFSEAPEVALTSITLKDSTGVAVPLGLVARDSSKLGVRAPITAPLKPGRYTVGWRVAGSDGHPISGSFTFLVLASAVTATESEAVVDTLRRDTTAANDVEASAPSGESPAQVATRFATFVALLVLIGAVAFKLGVMDRVGGLGNRARLEGMRALARVAGIAAFALVLASAARLQLQQEILTEPSHLVHLQTLAASQTIAA